MVTAGIRLVADIAINVGGHRRPRGGGAPVRFGNGDQGDGAYRIRLANSQGGSTAGLTSRVVGAELFGCRLLEDAVSTVRAQTRSFGRLAVDRIRQNRGLRLLTAAPMVGFVVMVYVVVVVGDGELAGQTGAPNVWLSVLATAMVAIAFEPGVTQRVPFARPRPRHQPGHPQ